MKFNLHDTIVAPATALSKQAISIIRVSGEKSFEIVNSLLNKELIYSNKPQLRKIFDDKNVIDEALLIPFVNGKSFTGEDVIEINCHGGIALTQKIIELLIKNGARLALSGEFSQRAYLNGKINLIQAQGISDLIDAKNEVAIKINALNMSGANNKIIESLREDLLDIISRIQTSIDYPDYDDIEGSTPEELILKLDEINLKINNIVARSKRAILSQDGIKTLILGETNVGKSSILNALINEDKAIVSNIEGTTRDIVEGQITLKNITINLIDTAGIRETNDIVEGIGINKAKELINTSDLILFVINYNKQNDEVYKLVKDKQHIVILNKKDELSDSQIKELENKYNSLILTQASIGNVDDVVNMMEKMYNNEELLKTTDPILTNINQVSQLELIKSKIDIASANLKEGFPIDLINIDLYEAREILNNLIGLVDIDEEVLDTIFRKYCLGK